MTESERERKSRHEAASAAALAARQQSGVPLDEPFDCLLTSVEGNFDLGVVIADIGEGIAGCLARRGDLNIVLIAAGDAAVRRRFTLAHELGHYQLSHGPSVDTPSTLNDQSDPEESSANRFAAEFIAPQQAVERFVGSLDDQSPTLELVCRVSNHFAISAWSARIRLETTGIIDDPELITRLDKEVASGEQKDCYERLGLADRDDLCALQAPQLPRLAVSFSESAFADFVGGAINAEQLALAVGASPAEVDELLGDSVG